MIIQLKEAKSVITLVFYVTPNKLDAARKAIEEMKPILKTHGFVVEDVVESKTSRPT